METKNKDKKKLLKILGITALAAGSSILAVSAISVVTVKKYTETRNNNITNLLDIVNRGKQLVDKMSSIQYNSGIEELDKTMSPFSSKMGDKEINEKASALSNKEILDLIKKIESKILSVEKQTIDNNIEKTNEKIKEAEKLLETLKTEKQDELASKLEKNITSSKESAKSATFETIKLIRENLISYIKETKEASGKLKEDFKQFLDKLKNVEDNLKWLLGSINQEYIFLKSLIKEELQNISKEKNIDSYTLNTLDKLKNYLSSIEFYYNKWELMNKVFYSYEEWLSIKSKKQISDESYLKEWEIMNNNLKQLNYSKFNDSNFILNKIKSEYKAILDKFTALNNRYENFSGEIYSMFYGIYKNKYLSDIKKFISGNFDFVSPWDYLSQDTTNPNDIFYGGYSEKLLNKYENQALNILNRDFKRFWEGFLKYLKEEKFKSDPEKLSELEKIIEFYKFMFEYYKSKNITLGIDKFLKIHKSLTYNILAEPEFNLKKPRYTVYDLLNK